MAVGANERVSLTCILTMLISMLTARASAQGYSLEADNSGVPDRPIERSVERIASTIFLAGCGVDVATTLAGRGSGSTHEGNPALKPLEENPPAFSTAVMSGCAGAVIGVRAVGRRHPRLAAITAVVLAAARVAVVVHNLQALGR